MTSFGRAACVCGVHLHLCIVVQNDGACCWISHERQQDVPPELATHWLCISPSVHAGGAFPAASVGAKWMQ